MNYAFLIIVSILALITIIYIRTKQCCGKKPTEFWPYPTPGYAPPGSDEAMAHLYQTDYLPPSDELVDDAGGFAQIAGIQSPRLSAKEDPWLSQRSYF